MHELQLRFGYPVALSVRTTFRLLRKSSLPVCWLVVASAKHDPGRSIGVAETLKTSEYLESSPHCTPIHFPVCAARAAS